jgi:DNA segregation ATPase FtsK/SpoIIIE-like protein
MGKGDFVVVARGESLRLQGPYVSGQEIKRIVTHLAEARRQDPSWGERVKGLTKRLVEALPAGVASAVQQATLFTLK